MACARDRAASRWAGEVPVEAPQLWWGVSNWYSRIWLRGGEGPGGEGREGGGGGLTYKTAMTGPAGVLAADESCPMLT